MTAAVERTCEAVLLIGFGGPTSPAEVRPFLNRVLAGRPVSRERYEEVVCHYEMLGGRSPYNELVMRQAAALHDSLNRRGLNVPVVVGFRNMPPYVDDALRELAGHGIRRGLGFILAAQRCEASWERYQDDVAMARERVGAVAPAIDYPGPWHAHPLFIQAVAGRARTAMARFNDDERKRAELLFTAHSIPVAMAERSPYVDQLNQSARLVAETLAHGRWSLAFQSRSGNPHERWLEPDISHALQELAGRPTVIIPLGFLCDHVEVLYDLDIEAAKIAREAGVRLERAETVSTHPSFITMMAEIAISHCSRPSHCKNE